MTVKKYDGGSGSPGEAERPMKRKVKVPRDKDGRTILTGNVKVPKDGEDFGDSGEDLPPPGEDESPRPRRTRERRREGKETPKRLILPEEEYEDEVDTKDGILQIMTNGTSEGTVVTLNGKKLNVKVILNLMIV